jgi:rare lipoprotein A (peptidoglycan hydrolase)
MTRQILPAAAAAAIVTIVPTLATAKQKGDARPKRHASHISLHLTKHDVRRGRTVVAHGRVRPMGAHRVKLVVRGRRGEVARTSSGRGGGFALRWSAPRAGSYAVRAYAVHDRRIFAAISPARRLTAYRPAAASYYGPGLYGNGVACGGTLLPGTLGVAHKTLPCGTKVRLRYHGRSVTVPVIDRGPYVAGRDYDLTEATKQRLGFPGVGVVLSSR